MLAGALVVPPKGWLLVLVVGCLWATGGRPVRLRTVELRWVVVTAAFWLAALLSIVASPRGATRGLDWLFMFASLPLAAVVVPPAVREVRAATLAVAAALGAAVAAVVGVVELVALGASRADGFTNAIVFGDLALVLGFLAFTLTPSVDWADRRGRLAIMGLSVGLFAAFLSASRGTLVAIPALVIVALWRHRSSGRAVVGTVIVCAVVLAAGAAHVVGARTLDRAVVAVEQIHEHTVSSAVIPERATSVGVRLDIWVAALAAFGDSPLLGIGWGSLQDHLGERVANGVGVSASASKRHAHNVFLGSLASGGLVGLAALSTLFGYPLLRFLRSRGDGDDVRRAVAAGGLVLVVAYLAFGLTEGMFDNLLPMAFFSFVVAALLTLVEAHDVSVVAKQPSGHDDRDGDLRGRASSLDEVDDVAEVDDVDEERFPVELVGAGLSGWSGPR